MSSATGAGIARVEVADDDRRAFVRESPRGRCADPAAAARDDVYLALEPPHNWPPAREPAAAAGGEYACAFDNDASVCV
jgi:hypothetical protein